MPDMLAFWADGILTVTWDTPYSVEERAPYGETALRVIETGIGPITKELAITLSDPDNEIDVVVP